MKTMFVGVIIVAIIALIALVAVVMINESNNEIIQQQEARLTELEIDVQKQREVAICDYYIQIADVIGGYDCLTPIIENPLYGFTDQQKSEFYAEKEAVIMQHMQNERDAFSYCLNNLSSFEQTRVDMIRRQMGQATSAEEIMALTDQLRTICG